MSQEAQIEGYTTSVILRAKATINGVNDGDNSGKDLYRYNNKFYTSYMIWLLNITKAGSKFSTCKRYPEYQGGNIKR